MTYVDTLSFSWPSIWEGALYYTQQIAEYLLHVSSKYPVTMYLLSIPRHFCKPSQANFIHQPFPTKNKTTLKKKKGMRRVNQSDSILHFSDHVRSDQK